MEMLTEVNLQSWSLVEAAMITTWMKTDSKNTRNFTPIPPKQKKKKAPNLKKLHNFLARLA